MKMKIPWEESWLQKTDSRGISPIDMMVRGLTSLNLKRSCELKGKTGKLLYVKMSEEIRKMARERMELYERNWNSIIDKERNKKKKKNRIENRVNKKRKMK